MIKTSPEVLRTLVAEPLFVNPDGQMIIYVADFNIVAPCHITYYESGMMIPVSDGHEEGVYMPILYLDKTVPIVVGREVWGFPKFQAELSLREENGVVHASVKSEGASLIEATLHLGEAIPSPDLKPTTIFLMKTMPSADQSSEYDVKQLTTAVIRDEIRHEVRPGNATLNLGSTPSDPLGLIPVIEILYGAYYTGGFVLDYGRIVRNFLEKKK
jgi:acetoacetate decarboxylase